MDRQHESPPPPTEVGALDVSPDAKFFISLDHWRSPRISGNIGDRNGLSDSQVIQNFLAKKVRQATPVSQVADFPVLFNLGDALQSIGLIDFGKSGAAHTQVATKFSADILEELAGI